MGVPPALPTLSPRPEGNGTRFRAFSRRAERMRLLLYDGPRDPVPSRTVVLDASTHRRDGVFETLVPGAGEGQHYLWAAEGPGLDPLRPLLDPYALALSGPERFGVDDPARLAARLPHAERNLDARFKCVVVAPPPATDWRRPARAWRDQVVYELHVRGFTRDPSSGVRHPGTFAGLAEKIPYLVDLGVTAVELLPAHEFDETETRPPGWERGTAHLNFWGYSPLQWFAVNRRYAADSGGARGPMDEFRRMVLAFHDAGIEVIADMVLNHTAELDAKGPVLSFRGLDPETYYLATDVTGCGNSVSANAPPVRRLILDVLAWWRHALGVDGFRLDLAAVLARGDDGRILDDPPLLREIEEDPALEGARLVAEPWDAAGGYLLDRWPGGERWALWNDRFRDDLRRAWFGDPRLLGTVATRLCGSSDLFVAGGSGPPRSLNFVTAHDGFTLRDVVSHARRHNDANGEEGRDGNPHEPSEPHGPEGPSDDPAVAAARERARRNLVASLLLAQGVPMLLQGDELGRTQDGNNNAYCLDGPLAWLDWRGVEADAAFHRFVRGLVRLRRSRAALRRGRWLAGRDHDGDGRPDALWLGDAGGPAAWREDDGAVGLLLSGARGETGAAADEEDLLLLLNLGDAARDFALPADRRGGRAWRLVVDTAAAPPADLHDPGRGPVVGGATFPVRSRSMALFVAAATVLEGPLPPS